MAVKSEQIEKNLVKLTFEVSAEDFEKAVQQAYLKNKNKIKQTNRETKAKLFLFKSRSKKEISHNLFNYKREPIQLEISK